jgi:hypothetical protein
MTLTGQSVTLRLGCKFAAEKLLHPPNLFAHFIKQNRKFKNPKKFRGNLSFKEIISHTFS